MSPALKSNAPNLWTGERPFKLPLILGDIGTRMTIVKLADGGLFLSRVSVPASTCSRSSGHGIVASSVGSPGCPTLRIIRPHWKACRSATESRLPLPSR